MTAIRRILIFPAIFSAADFHRPAAPIGG